MARNKMEDLRDHLFAQLERLGDENLTTEELELERNRAKSIVSVAAAITETAKVECEFLEVIGGTGTGSQLFNGVQRQLDKP